MWSAVFIKRDERCAWRRIQQHCVGVVICLFTLTSGSALAQMPDKDAQRAREALSAGLVLPLSEILQHVTQSYDGEIIGVKFSKDDGRYVYKLKLLDINGRIIKLEVDAQNAELLSMKR